MQHAEQYFAELFACLDALPDNERQEILAYHREYAAEAGLTSYEDLVSHFGTPQQLADRLCAELDARRAAPSPEAGSATRTLGDVVRDLLESLLSPVTEAEAEAEQATQALPPFHSVDIRTVAADLFFEEGEQFAVRYSLPAGEQLERLEVINGTLYFSTRGKRVVRLGGSHGGEVTVAIPRDTELKTVRLTTVSGDIVLTDRTCVDLEVKTTSGDVQCKQVDCTGARLNTVSGDVRLTTFGCDSFTAGTTSGDVECLDLAGNRGSIRTVSGDVECQVELDTLALSTISGDCSVDGPIRQTFNANSVSGNLRVHAPQAALDGATVSGRITVNGTRSGCKARMDGTGCRLTLRSTSGDIDIAL